MLGRPGIAMLGETSNCVCDCCCTLWCGCCKSSSDRIPTPHSHAARRGGADGATLSHSVNPVRGHVIANEAHDSTISSNNIVDPTQPVEYREGIPIFSSPADNHIV